MVCRPGRAIRGRHELIISRASSHAATNAFMRSAASTGILLAPEIGPRSLPTPRFADPELLSLAALVDTAKHRDGSRNLPLLTELGKVTFVNDLRYDEMETAARAMQRIAERPLSSADD